MTQHHLHPYTVSLKVMSLIQNSDKVEMLKEVRLLPGGKLQLTTTKKRKQA